jgi:CRP/FNR family cyclic AMP-dependent transcriptional regulator
VGGGRTISNLPQESKIFSQGEPADCVFYILKGEIKISVVSEQGREAVVALLGKTSFAARAASRDRIDASRRPWRSTECEIMRIEKDAIMTDAPQGAGLFRDVRCASSLEDDPRRGRPGRSAVQFQRKATRARAPSSCKFRQGGKPEPIITKVSQELLAEMIGTTRSRVSFFMNKFRKLGFISYNGKIEVHSSLLAWC